MKGSAFKACCTEMWYQHCDEVEAWTGSNPRYLSAEYFGLYKHWLRREYRAQKGK